MKKTYGIPLVSIKWHTVTCFEMKFGNKTVLSDPFINLSPGTEATVEEVEGADLIPVTHIHWDHITDIAYFMEKFGARVLVGDLSAMELAKYLNQNVHFLYPVTHNTELDFGWVKVKALMGRHSNMNSPFLTSATSFQRGPYFKDYPELASLQYFGSLEYRNYLITTPEHLKILLYGNTPCEEQKNLLKNEGIDIAILQFTRPIPDEIAQFAADLGAKVLIPHHMDLKKKPEEYESEVEVLCQAFEKKRPGGIAIRVQHGQWYDFNFGMSIR